MTDCEEVEKKRAELEALRTDVERLQDEAVREQNALENVLLNVVDLGCAPSGLPRVLGVVLRLLAARGALDAAQTPRDRRALALHARTAAALAAAFRLHTQHTADSAVAAYRQPYASLAWVSAAWFLFRETARRLCAGAALGDGAAVDAHFRRIWRHAEAHAAGADAAGATPRDVLLQPLAPGDTPPLFDDDGDGSGDGGCATAADAQDTVDRVLLGYVDVAWETTGVSLGLLRKELDPLLARALAAFGAASENPPAAPAATVAQRDEGSDTAGSEEKADKEEGEEEEEEDKDEAWHGVMRVVKDMSAVMEMRGLPLVYRTTYARQMCAYIDATLLNRMLAAPELCTAAAGARIAAAVDELVCWARRKQHPALAELYAAALAHCRTAAAVLCCDKAVFQGTSSTSSKEEDNGKAVEGEEEKKEKDEDEEAPVSWRERFSALNAAQIHALLAANDDAAAACVDVADDGTMPLTLDPFQWHSA